MREFSDPSEQLLLDVERGMPITADLSRSDLLLLRPTNSGKLTVIAQAQPHSIQPLHADSLVKTTWTQADAPVAYDALRKRSDVSAHREILGGATVVHDVRPIFDKSRRLIGLLSMETSLIQLERHRQRHRSFRRAIKWVKTMCARGELAGAEGLSPFAEMDGVVLVDVQGRITYLSGIANNLYRRLGYMEDLRGRRLSYLTTKDDEMFQAALESRQPVEREVIEAGHIWVRKVLPVWAPHSLRGQLARILSRHGPVDVDGAIITIHDATEEHRKREELQVKTTMIQEVHHRVKNNLQTIAAMLRMQARRAQDGATQQALNEAIARILSVAVIHEFLSLDENQSINVRDVCQRIVSQTRQVMTPGAQVEFAVEGPSIYLPSQQATACALVINELVQNALEHGFSAERHGLVHVILTDGGDRVQIEVCDDGAPLPDNFDIHTSTSLGLQIVRSLVQGDLHGQVQLENQERGVVATVAFPKVVLTRGSGG